jgi:hypothetical protein
MPCARLGRPLAQALAGLLLLLVLSASPILAAETAASGSPRGSDAEPERVVYASTPAERGEQWEYDPYYVFPLTRHMSESGLPFPAQIALYPIGFALDLAQWPVGLLAGLAGK